MADNIENIDNIDNTVEPEKKFSSDDVSKIVKERLERANAGKDDLAKRLAALEADHQRLVTAAQQVNIDPNAASPAPVTPQSSPVSPEPVGQSPLTQDGLTQALEAHQTAMAQQKQDQQFQQASNYHDQNLQQLMGGDKDFSDLVTNNQEKVPRAVAIHVSNNFQPETAKKIFKELLSNENTNLKMKNAYLEELQQPDTGAYQNWLRQLMKQNPNGAPATDKVPEPVPELAGGESNSDEDDLEGMMNYMSNR